MTSIFNKALKNNHYVNISEFSPGTGLNCGCFCPECGKKVGSRIFIDSPLSSCFFHESDQDPCNGGIKETELHLLAKDIIEKTNSILLPGISDEHNSILLKYSHVELEKKLGNIRPDIILFTEDNKQIIIEIAVTHFIKNSPEKLSWIATSTDIPVIEIDLSQYKECEIQSEYTKIEKSVIREIKNKNWLKQIDSSYPCEITLKSNWLQDLKKWCSENPLEIIFLTVLTLGAFCFLIKSRKHKKMNYNRFRSKK